MTKLKNPNEEKYPVQQIVQEQLDIHKKKNKCQLRPHILNKKYTQWKKVFSINRNKKISGEAKPVSVNIEFKTKTVCKRQRRTLHNGKGSN